MKKKVYGAIMIAGAALLSGCSTPEIRKETPVTSDLTFNSDTKNQNTDVSQKQTEGKASPTTPVTQPNNVTNKKMYTTPPQMAIDTNKQYTATLKTDVGDIVIALDAKAVPITANNFVFLAREKFYDGVIFHRTIPGFMIQGGDPTGTGAGGPGYQFADEPFNGEYTRGTVAMANAGPDTNGSQFFIMHKDTVLPKAYVIFGHVTAGLDVVDKIAMAPTRPGGEGSSPVTPVHMQTVVIAEK